MIQFVRSAGFFQSLKLLVSFLLDSVGMLHHARMLVSVLIAVLAEVLQALKSVSYSDVVK